jgi:hypothetical protein
LEIRKNKTTQNNTAYLLVAASGGETETAGLDVDGEDLQALVANPARLLRNHLLLPPIIRR